MGGKLSVAFGGSACYLAYNTGSPIFFGFSVFILLGTFWSWGVMHNYATNAAKRRSNYSGGIDDITIQEAEMVPEWIAYVNMGFSLAALIVLIVSIFLVA